MFWLGTLHGGPAISAIEQVYARLGGVGGLEEGRRQAEARAVRWLFC